MRSEVDITPYWRWYMPYLDGEPLSDCRMADEERGCAEVYVLNEAGHRTPETRMVFGNIELRPLAGLDPWNNALDAARIDARQRALDDEFKAAGFRLVCASPRHLEEEDYAKD